MFRRSCRLESFKAFSAFSATFSAGLGNGRWSALPSFMVLIIGGIKRSQKIPIECLRISLIFSDLKGGCGVVNKPQAVLRSDLSLHLL